MDTINDGYYDTDYRGRYHGDTEDRNEGGCNVNRRQQIKGGFM